MTKDVWEHIAETLAAGEEPSVSVLPSMLKPLPKKKIGRPKNTTKAHPYLLHRSAAFLGGKTHPRCMNTGCKKRLHTNDFLVCNEYCRKEAVNQYRAALHLLLGKKFVIEPIREIPHAGGTYRQLPTRDRGKGSGQGAGTQDRGSGKQARGRVSDRFGAD